MHNSKKSSTFAPDFKTYMKKLFLIVMMAYLPFSALFADRTADASAKKTYKEKVVLACDLHCQGCCDKIMKNIAFEKGVKDIVCDLKTKTVTVTYDASKTNAENIQTAMKKIGYDTKVVSDKPQENRKKK